MAVLRMISYIYNYYISKLGCSRILRNARLF